MSSVENLLKEAEVLLSGHFCLTSGLHSDKYFQCAKLYQNPMMVEKIAKEVVKSLEGLEFDTVVAPAIGAVIFGYEVAKQAGVRNLFTERNSGGVMELRRGYSLEKGERVVVVEDVITTAKTIYETISAISQFEPEIVGVGCIVDRTGGKFDSGGDLNIISALKADPVLHQPDNCPLCAAGIELVKPGSRA